MWMMMSSKLFFFAVINYALCFQSLFHLQFSACAQYMISNGTQLVTTNSCTSAPSMECADLGSITYPFWGSASCAASPSYVLSNCSSSSSSSPAYWDAFSAAVHGVVGPPEVTNLSSRRSDIGYPYYSIQLSWNKSLNDLGICASPFSSEDLSQYNIPSSIDLARFNQDENSTLRFSDGSQDYGSDSTTLNVFLLFNCTNNASNAVAQLGYEPSYIGNQYGCTTYKVSCSAQPKTPCIQWNIDSTLNQLRLQDVLNILSCSHFTFGIASVNSYQMISDWKLGSIGLSWTDNLCNNCTSAKGTCIVDKIFPNKFNHCECAYFDGTSTPFDFNTQTCEYNSGCQGGILHCNRGAKIGISVALGIVVLIFGLAIVARCCGRMIGKRLRIGFITFIKTIIPIAISCVLKKTLKELQTSSYSTLRTMDLEGLTERPMEYSYSSIACATKSFSSLVGEGGFGVVYKGTLPQASSSDGGSDLQIAVKVLEVRSKHSKQQFLNEVITIGRIHHINVVRLLGFCMQEDHEMLVYEYIENGSLDRWLFNDQQGGRNQKQVLGWGQRHAIALGIARGLSYLHEECRHRTVHCDIKPQNILLDGEMCPKIADFGLARLMSRDESKVVTLAKGTPGYMAPEFWMGGESQLSTKFDVYSYGMVLLELIGGQRNFRRNVAISSSSSFPAMAFKAAMQGDLESIVDARLGITKNTSDADEVQKLQWSQIRTVALVALWCIQDRPTSRPCMSEVVKYLEGGATVPESPPQPSISTSSTISIPQESISSSSHDHQQDDFTPMLTGR